MKGSFCILLFASALTLFSSVRVPAAGADPKADYTYWARELSGERASAPMAAIRHLSAMAGLDDRLRQEVLHGDARLALKVIRALKRTELTETLLPIAPADSSGEVYETLISLRSPPTAPRVTTVALEQLAQNARAMSPAALVGLLQLLRENEARIPPAQLEALLTHESFEVREAVVAYLGNTLKAPYYPILGRAIASHPYQLRERALELAARLNPRELAAAALPLSGCSDDPNPGVRRLCRQIQTRTAKGGHP